MAIRARASPSRLELPECVPPSSATTAYEAGTVEHLAHRLAVGLAFGDPDPRASLTFPINARPSLALELALGERDSGPRLRAICALSLFQ